MAKRKTTKKTTKKVSPSKTNECKDWKMYCSTPSCSSSTGGVYFLGFVGAIVYYLSTSTGFWMGVWGIVKALVWPAFLVFELLKYLGA